MDIKLENAIIEYQCSGCINGPIIIDDNQFTSGCFKNSPYSSACYKHRAGTLMSGIGKIFLGLPSGFNRLGTNFNGEENMKIEIFESFNSANEVYNWGYDKYNIPVWKHLNKNEHTLVRGLIPRTNRPFLHIYLENCVDKIDCFEVDEDMINYMD